MSKKMCKKCGAKFFIILLVIFVVLALGISLWRANNSSAKDSLALGDNQNNLAAVVGTGVTPNNLCRP
jgi:hypothetical protein